MNSLLYRTPPDPGPLGGLYVRPMIMALLTLFLANCAATQYIAQHFGYQEALGQPLMRLHGNSVYQPFAWISWVWIYGRSQNPEVTNPLVRGVFLVVAGSLSSGAIFFVLNLYRPRTFCKNTEDLYGSAGFACLDEIRKTHLLNSSQGVYVGGWYDKRTQRLCYLRHNGPEHVLAFAPTRTGKGVSLVIPTLLAWSESVVVYDIKGDNWAKTAGFRAYSGQICLKFSPVEQGHGTRFNPLDEIRIGTLREVSDAQNLAEMIVDNGQEWNFEDPHWQQTAKSLTTGLILHICYAARLEQRSPNLAMLYAMFTKPGVPFRDTLTDLLHYPHDRTLQYNWRMPNGESTATHPVVRQKTQEMLNREEREFSSIVSTATAALSIYSDPLIAKNTESSDFQISDLVDHAQPVSLYVVVPPSEMDRIRPLTRLVFTMIVNRLTERLTFHGTKQEYHKHRLLLLIDEFPSLKRMTIFARALSYMAGFGLTAYLITQDIRQIVAEYGANESIVSNCGIRAAFTPNHYETAALLSKMTGVKTIQKASFNFSGSRGASLLDHVNESLHQTQRPLLTPDEVLRMPAPLKEGESENERIVWPGDMLLFVAGHRPIYGKQMLYFFDEVLSARAEISPPKDLPRIEGQSAPFTCKSEAAFSRLTSPLSQRPGEESEEPDLSPSPIVGELDREIPFPESLEETR